MCRRHLLVLITLLASVLAAVESWRTPVSPRDFAGPTWLSRIRPETRANRPSILFVILDARRRDDFSFGRFGNRRGDTPFLAAFARDAVTFEDAVTPGCWTLPVHAALFSGLSVCDVGNDYYNAAYASFPTHFLSLAEILRVAGYRTIAYADHPHFFAEWRDLSRAAKNRDARASLVRGFELFNVINDFQRFGSYTNVGTAAGDTVLEYRLAGMDRLSMSDVRKQIAEFNRAEIRFRLEAESDYDAKSKFHLPHLYDLFQDSPYFERRYGREFDAYVFNGRTDPYFLFLNLHMCTAEALPDPGLYQRWLLKTLLMNAQALGVRPGAGLAARSTWAYLWRNLERLDLRPSGFPDTKTYLKHVFDNRFYDATFRSLWEYLERRGLTRDLVTLVTSDHGLSLSENGEWLYAHAGARPYEYMVRVPLILRFPAGSELTRFNGLRTEIVSLTDVFPTLVEVGLGRGVFERDLPVRGRSLIERLERNTYESQIVAESSLRPNRYWISRNVVGYAKAVYWNGMKLIYAPRLWQLKHERRWWPYDLRLGAPWPGGELGPAPVELEDPFVMLFDLQTDPHESDNLASRRPEIVEQMVRQLPGDWDCKPLVAAFEEPQWDHEALETLRSLGYVQ